MDVHLGGDKVIRFWASGGTAFKSKIAAQLFHCSYLGDYLSYTDLKFGTDVPCMTKTKLVNFGPQGALSSIPRWPPNISFSISRRLFELQTSNSAQMLLGGDKLIRFWAPGGAAFNSKMAPKIFNFSYRGDYLSYRLEIWYRCSLYDKEKISKFWTPGGAVFDSKMAAKIFPFPYLGDY